MPQQNYNTQNHVTYLIWAAVLAVISVLFILTLALRPPPAHYLVAAGLACYALLITSAVLFLAWLVLRISATFGANYAETAEAVKTHQRATVEQMHVITGQMRTILGTLGDLGAKLREAQGTMKTAGDQWAKAAESIEALSNEHQALGEQLDELQEAFLAEGLPQNRRLTRAAPETGTLGAARLTASSVSR